MLALVLLLAALLLAGAALCFWSDALLREALAGRQAQKTVGADYVSSFALSAEESFHQTQPRISGWLNLVSSQEVITESPRGTLSSAMYTPFDARGSAPWALVLHGGLGTDREQVLDVACELSLKGYYVVAPDLYGHGQSEGKTASLGLADSQDVHAWIGWILRQQSDARIVIFGQDEGAVAALLAASEGLDAHVAAVAVDSAYDDGLSRVLDVAGFEKKTPQGALIALGLWRAGAKETKVSAVIERVQIPLLLIHGTGDQIVPAWQSEDIALAAQGNAQLLFIEGAGHGQSRYVDRETYYHTMMGFFESALNGK